MWQRVKAAWQFWMTSEVLADSARFYTRIMGPTVLVLGVVGAIVQSWAAAALCLLVALVTTAYGWAPRNSRT